MTPITPSLVANIANGFVAEKPASSGVAVSLPNSAFASASSCGFAGARSGCAISSRTAAIAAKRQADRPRRRDDAELGAVGGEVPQRVDVAPRDRRRAWTCCHSPHEQTQATGEQGASDACPGSSPAAHAMHHR